MLLNTFHFLNVKDGDCSIIKHGSGHLSVVDVCNARKPPQTQQEQTLRAALNLLEQSALEKGAELIAHASRSPKNYGQKKYPDNPIEYLHKHYEYSIFRYMLTHPDMDHMDGIKDLFELFSPGNFYDTSNNKEIDSWNGSPYREEDWRFYKNLRDTRPTNDPKRLEIFSGDDGIHRTKDWSGQPFGDRFYTLAPTPALVDQANEKSGDYHDLSYVVLWFSPVGRILMCGDSHDATWEHILENHAELVRDVDIMIAPHHGRKSSRDWSFLDTVNPKLTLFGNAQSKHLAYDAFRSRNLEYITNNQAGYIVVDCNLGSMKVFVKNQFFAEDYTGNDTWHSSDHDGWFLKSIDGWALKNAAAATSSLLGY